MTHPAPSSQPTSDGFIYSALDFSVVRFGGPVTKNDVRDLSAPKINRGQIIAALDASGGGFPARLILGSSYQQFADAHVAQPPGLIREAWQPLFLVVAHRLADGGDGGNQSVQIMPLYLLSLLDPRTPRLAITIIHLMNDRPEPRRDITARELIAVWDELSSHRVTEIGGK